MNKSSMTTQDKYEELRKILNNTKVYNTSTETRDLYQQLLGMECYSTTSYFEDPIVGVCYQINCDDDGRDLGIFSEGSFVDEQDQFKPIPLATLASLKQQYFPEEEIVSEVSSTLEQPTDTFEKLVNICKENNFGVNFYDDGEVVLTDNNDNEYTVKSLADIERIVDLKVELASMERE